MKIIVLESVHVSGKLIVRYTLLIAGSIPAHFNT
jgi:hypothetical protein